MSVYTFIENNIVYVSLQNPPGNVIGLSVRQGLLAAVQLAETERVDRVIVSGDGKTFSTGTDDNDFDSVPIEPHLRDVVDAIDKSFVPWIAAIEGDALGGGAEIALACRLRIFHPSARIGFPEVSLGVIPSAGATQRLPKLVGLGKALHLLTSGKPIGAKDAKETGLVYAIDEDPLEAAFLVNSEELQSCVPTWEFPPPMFDNDIVREVKVASMKKFRGQEAPDHVLDVVVAGLSMDFSAAITLESEVNSKLRCSNQARGLRHIFYAERAARKPASLADRSVPLIQGVVVGGGTMGAGICYALISENIKVVLLEADVDSLERASKNVESILLASLKRGLIDVQEADALRARIIFSTDFSDAANANFAIEAAFENMDVKKSIFEKLAEHLSNTAVLATNTSYLDVNEIAKGIPEPQRLVGLHFFAPAYIMKLLEIVKGEKTGEVALSTAYEIGKKLGKIPVVSGVCDGFIGNRILARYREAADTVLLEGSTPWEIDEAMVEFGYPMGPYEAQDLSGLDIAHANRRRQDNRRDPNRRYILIADRMVELGKLGKKVGAGWYRYPGGGGKVEDPIVADLALEEARFAGIERRDFTAEEIQERLVLAIINEASDILDEKIAGSASDIDIVTVAGYGFPRWRGGLMHYANTLGAKAIVDSLDKLALEDPVAWKVSPLLRERAFKDAALE